jgi:hypothetical protein
MLADIKHRKIDRLNNLSELSIFGGRQFDAYIMFEQKAIIILLRLYRY